MAEATKRHIHLVLENDDNASGLLDPVTPFLNGMYRAQWNDDYHHAWHVLLTGETHAYYRDYRTSPLQDIARALSSGFVYQGEPSEHRGGKPRGEPSQTLPPLAFINFLQNHDQIGNRALGDRLTEHADPKALEAALVITLLAPTVPMLFMGEEWGSTRRFPFFCDFKGELAEAVRSGRRREFADAYAQYADEIPDPIQEEALHQAVLDWDARTTTPGKRYLELVRNLLIVRQKEIVPRLIGAKFGAAQVAAGVLTARWVMGDGAKLNLTANLSDQGAKPIDMVGTLIWGHELADSLPPWMVSWRIE